ncbi:hypothetical protein L1987_21441 [Smallanthus sonchifolius]|uniref:Uncharacterized protein n=1 Tax=Smallanthus sonchifolius TaxID=185202 RepID=A0ACB9IV43_9ASTR|nr:hypothetical protein L1987_21441 [Smallanthus sonchifolius]
MSAIEEQVPDRRTKTRSRSRLYLPSSPTHITLAAGTTSSTHRRRQRIAIRLKDSQNTFALLTTFNEVDMTNLMKLRSECKDAFLEKHGVKLGLMSGFVKCSTVNKMLSVGKLKSLLSGRAVGSDLHWGWCRRVRGGIEQEQLDDLCSTVNKMLSVGKLKSLLSGRAVGSDLHWGWRRRVRGGIEQEQLDDLVNML